MQSTSIPDDLPITRVPMLAVAWPGWLGPDPLRNGQGEMTTVSFKVSASGSASDNNNDFMTDVDNVRGTLIYGARGGFGYQASGSHSTNDENGRVSIGVGFIPAHSKFSDRLSQAQLREEPVLLQTGLNFTAANALDRVLKTVYGSGGLSAARLSNSSGYIDGLVSGVAKTYTLNSDEWRTHDAIQGVVKNVSDAERKVEGPVRLGGTGSGTRWGARLTLRSNTTVSSKPVTGFEDPTRTGVLIPESIILDRRAKVFIDVKKYGRKVKEAVAKYATGAPITADDRTELLSLAQGLAGTPYLSPEEAAIFDSLIGDAYGVTSLMTTVPQATTDALTAAYNAYAAGEQSPMSYADWLAARVATAKAGVDEPGWWESVKSAFGSTADSIAKWVGDSNLTDTLVGVGAGAVAAKTLPDWVWPVAAGAVALVVLN